MATTDGIDPTLGTTPAAALATSGAQAQTPEQLRTLAAQFESMLLTQMMNAMRSSMFDDESEDTGFAKGPLADALYSELSMALSRAGGFGFTDSMMGPLMNQTGVGTGAAAGLANPLGIAMPAFTGDLQGTSGRADGIMGASLTPASLAAEAAMTSVGAAASPEVGRMPAFLSARVSSQYGWRQDPINGNAKFHAGTDIAVPVGQDVPSASAGRVTFAGERSGYGLTVEVEHVGGMTTRYAHLSELAVAAGDAVAAGQTLAKSGATGRVTGPHLHFEVLDQGQAVEPSSGLMKLALTGRLED